MHNYIVRRLALVIPTLLGVSVIVFYLINLVPGDAIVILLQGEVEPERLEHLRRVFGLDRPLHVQLLAWFSGLLRGDLGTSIAQGVPVSTLIAERIGPTVQLAFVAVLVSLVISIPLGIFAAINHRRFLDSVAGVVGLIGLSLPNFWLATLLVLLFSLRLGMLPPSGYVSPAEDLVGFLRYVAMPAIALGLAQSGAIVRMTRSTMLEVLGEDYVRTARAKGLPMRVVHFKHSLKNAILPVLTVIGIQTGRLLGGTVIIESIFGWPGIGSLIIEAINVRDYPLVQGGVLTIASMFVLINVSVDIAYAYVDPRIRYS